MSGKSKQKHRPKGKPRQKQTVNKPESKSKITRRRALFALAGVGTGIAMWRAGLFDAFKDKEEEQTPLTTDNLAKKPESAEWMSVDLPVVEYNENKHWSGVELSEHFLPKGVNKEVGDEFASFFTIQKDLLISNLERVSDIEERKQLVKDFINQISRRLPGGVILQDGKTIDLRKTLDQVSRILIPSGKYFEGARERGDVNLKLIATDIDNVSTLQVNIDGGSKEIPAIRLANRQNILIDPNSIPIEFNAAYYNNFDYLIMDESHIENSVKANLSFEKLCLDRGIQIERIGVEGYEKLSEVGLQHEGMHAALYSKFKNQSKTDSIKPGDINMGHYVLSTPKFEERITNMQIHELAANGFGLQNAGEMAARIAFIINNSSGHELNYHFSSFVLLHELLHCPALSSGDHAVLLSQLQRGIRGEEAAELLVKKIPNAELIKIGERMAKLGMHLMEKSVSNK